MTVLAAHDLHKAFGDRAVLGGVSLTIDAGERVGLIGKNGSGKSTLTRLLAGLEPPDGGHVARRRGASVLYLAQEPELDPTQSPRAIVTAGLAAWTDAKARYDRTSAALATGEGDLEATLAEQAEAAADVERLGGWDRTHEVEAILGHLGVSRLDEPVGPMSGGEKRRVALARILVAKPDLAILDEPSNHLDAETIAWLEEHLIDEFPGALLLITHDRYLLDRLVTRTLELDQGVLHAYDGGYGMFLEQKAERQALAARTEQNRQNFLRTEIEWLRRQPKARTTKQKARIERAETAKAAPKPVQEKTATLTLDASRSGKTVVELHHVTLEIAGRKLVDDLTLSLVAGERVGVLGRNGTGKTTLLRALMGEVQPARGEIVLGKNATISYFDQQRSGLDDEKSIYDNVVTETRMVVGGEEMDARSYLERFLFDPRQQRKPVAGLSGGERARVALAKMLARKSSLVLFDEPTNDLDLDTLSALEEMLVGFPGTAIIVTHDRYFLDRVATSILSFEGDGKVQRYAGAYQAFEAEKKLKDEREAAAREQKREAPKGAREARRGLSKDEERELAGILDRIEAAEAEVSRIDGALAEPDLYVTRDDPRVPKLKAELAEARAEAERLTARWEALEAKKAS